MQEKQSIFRQVAFTPTTFREMKQLQERFAAQGQNLNNNQLLALVIQAAVRQTNEQHQVEVHNHEQRSSSK
jgi:hypothetical protein